MLLTIYDLPATKVDNERHQLLADSRRPLLRIYCESNIINL